MQWEFQVHMVEFPIAAQSQIAQSLYFSIFYIFHKISKTV